jgi:hypothetical protein
MFDQVPGQLTRELRHEHRRLGLLRIVVDDANLSGGRLVLAGGTGIAVPGLDDAGPFRHARVIAHTPEQRGDAGMPRHAAIREMLLDGQHRHGLEELRITTAMPQQPGEGLELPVTAR